MSLAVLDAHETANGLAVTFITDSGLEPLEGTYEEVGRLAQVMKEVSALAALNDTESVWVQDVVVGSATVRLGLKPGKQARVQIIRD